MAETDEICKFYIEGRCRFADSCRNSHPDGMRVLPPPKAKKSKKKPVKETDKEKNDSSKLPPMKTARDVIHRIQWDTDIPSQYVTVGYLDRFVGVVEQPFNMFDWTSDIATLSHVTVLAIPQHRIQYFKYRGKKLWDKNERLDLIFGSTSTSIADVRSLLGNIDEELQFQEDTLSDAEPEVIGDKERKPTHFLAIRIDSEDLCTTLRDTVASLTRSSAIAPELYHCTLALLSLESPDQILRCADLMQSIASSIFVDPPRQLDLRGLATYRDRVLFSRICSNPSLDAMVVSLTNHIKSSGLHVYERPEEFHVSLVKGCKNMKRVDQEKVVCLERESFGQQPIEFIHLCTLREAVDMDGFYRVVTSIQVGGSSADNT